jgi:pyruvate/2-oxoglutarate dehydrogenase complex dihydrolipoamide acyltransferase (E2) component
LNYRLVRGVQSSVPVSIMIEVDWSPLEKARQIVKARGGQETGFTMMLWCVAETLKKHAKFRTTLIEDGKTFRTFEDVNLGIAVALPGDALVTAVVHEAGKYDRNAFFAQVAKQIETARSGVDQADASTTISVSNIGSAGIRWGIPAVVPPAVATLALGEVFESVARVGSEFVVQKRAQLTLAFDHRVLNGVGAANFMNDLKTAIESYTTN